ncbi:hypothetical protein HMPREF9999_00227 [Alloprevotella sp. oral taxon 473 str. F0040]|nr:hypothetical protein HMPREF9999_00227 [Alloprevotella sp. oral taxon 473 str. F0040]
MRNYLREFSKKLRVHSLHTPTLFSMPQRYSSLSPFFKTTTSTIDLVPTASTSRKIRYPLYRKIGFMAFLR